MMRYQITLLILLSCFFSCEEVIDIDTPTSEPRLVIEATFNRYFNTQPAFVEGGVKLSLTVPYFESNTQYVKGAQVFITDTTNGIIYPATDDGSINGYYPIDFEPEFDTTYQLTIVHEGQTYSAAEKMMAAPVIDTLVKGTNTLFDGESKELKTTFTDIPNESNFYFFDFDFGNYLVVDDNNIEGNQYTFSFFYDDLVTNTLVDVKILGSSERFNNYFRILQAQSGEASGGPFATPSAVVRGNIFNETQPENYPLGYFRISEGDIKSFTAD